MDLHEALAELRQVFEANGTCSTYQQDLLRLALSALPPPRPGGSARLIYKNYVAKLGLFLVALVRSVL